MSVPAGPCSVGVPDGDGSGWAESLPSRPASPAGDDPSRPAGGESGAATVAAESSQGPGVVGTVSNTAASGTPAPDLAQPTSLFVMGFRSLNMTGSSLRGLTGAGGLWGEGACNAPSAGAGDEPPALLCAVVPQRESTGVVLAGAV
jgi:hypothetical protein